MKPWIRLLAPTAAALGLTLMASPMAARPDAARHRGMDHLEAQIEGLELDAATRDAAFALLDQAREQRRQTAPELRAAREQMRALLDSEAPDEAAVMAQAEAIGALELSASKARLGNLLALRQVLGTEQWEQLRLDATRHKRERRDR